MKSKFVNFYLTCFSWIVFVSGYTKQFLPFKNILKEGKYFQNRLKSSSFEKSYDVESWRNCYSSCLKETEEEWCNIFPKDITGTFFRNGPGNFNIGDYELLHPFDGDGMITAITIQNGNAIFRNRFVQTIDYRTERKLQKIVRRGAFRTLKPGGIFTNLFDAKVKNVANTNVLYWNQKLLALWEGGKPYFVDPKSLATLSDNEEDLNQQLFPTESFTAHPKIDPFTKTLVAFSVQNELSRSTIRALEFNEELKLIFERGFEYPGLPVCHDFLITENFILLFLPSVKFDLLPILFGQKSPTECIRFQSDNPTKLFIIPRNSDATVPIEEIDLDPHFSFHFANAFEEDGSIFFDSFRCTNFQMGLPFDEQNRPIPWKLIDYENEIPFPTLVRYKITKVGREWIYEKRTLSDTQLDFGTINPQFVGRKYQYCYALCGSHPTKSTPFQGFVKIDTVLGREWKWMPEPFEFIGEMTFIPKSDPTALKREEDDGYLMSFLANGKTNQTSIVLFDARDITKGPILRQPILSTQLPIMLHGSYAPHFT